MISFHNCQLYSVIILPSVVLNHNVIGDSDCRFVKNLNGWVANISDSYLKKNLFGGCLVSWIITPQKQQPFDSQVKC